MRGKITIAPTTFNCKGDKICIKNISRATEKQHVRTLRVIPLQCSRKNFIRKTGSALSESESHRTSLKRISQIRAMHERPTLLHGNFCRNSCFMLPRKIPATTSRPFKNRPVYRRCICWETFIRPHSLTVTS